jgi:hypothetical protein
MTPIELLLAKLPDATPAGKGWSARCPAHEDRLPSLSVAVGDNGGAVVKCHAGCSPQAICAALGLCVADLMPANGSRADGKPRIVATYDYRDEAGVVLFQVVRYEPKGFRQRRPKAGGGWDWSVKGLRKVPYRLPELLADPSKVVFVVEGEKDVDNLAGIGIVATCNAGGAGKWIAAHAEFLRERIVIILADNDTAGRNHAQQVAQSLQGVAASVRIVKLPGLPEKGDVSDWIAAGGTKAELDHLAESTPEWTPTAATPWPEILSFDSLDLPEFPTHVLPTVLRNWVEAESHATQTPADLAGLLGLAVCSAGIARHVVVEPRRGWREPTNLFAAVLLEPGNRKSAVFGDATNPLKELEGERIAEARPLIAIWQSQRRQAELRLHKLEKTAGEKNDDESRHEATKIAAELADEPEPVLPRLIVDDATAEKLGMMLADQGGRIASMSAEGGVFDLMAGLYSRNGIPQFDVYLKGHAGDDLRTDRVSRKGVLVERPALTCAYAMQPVVIRGLAGNPAFRGRGLLARFLYAAPQSWIGRREIAPAPVSDATREAYRQVVRAMAEVEREAVLQLSAEAANLLWDWESEIESMLGDGGRLEIMRDWGGKLAGATVRLAAVLHCVEHGPEGRVGAATNVSAIAIARYLIPHAEAVLAMMVAKEKSADDDARYLLRWIERHGRREFTKSESQHHGKRRFPRADDIDPALHELVRRGFIRPKSAEVAGPGRPPSPVFDVNQAIFDAPEKRSHNSRIAATEPDNGISGNIGSASRQTETTDRKQVTI